MKLTQPGKISLVIVGLLLLILIQTDSKATTARTKATLSGKMESGFSLYACLNDSETEDDYEDDDEAAQTWIGSFYVASANKLIPLKLHSFQRSYSPHVSHFVFICCFRI